MRDSAETGDPDTTKGQFPSEQEGAGGGGGGGGGGRPAPIQIMEDPAVSRSLGGEGDGGSGMIALDNRRIGGSLYGVYQHTINYPFKGNTYSYETSMIGQEYIGIFTTATITGVTNLMGAIAKASITNGSVDTINVVSLTANNFSITQDFFSPAINSYHNALAGSVSGLSIPTGSSGRFSFVIPLAFPAMYYEYNLFMERGRTLATYSPIPIKGANNGFGPNTIFRGKRRIRYIHPASSMTGSMSLFMNLYNNDMSAVTFDGTLNLEIATANPTPNLTEVTYPTYGT